MLNTPNKGILIMTNGDFAKKVIIFLLIVILFPWVACGGCVACMSCVGAITKDKPTQQPIGGIEEEKKQQEILTRMKAEREEGERQRASILSKSDAEKETYVRDTVKQFREYSKKRAPK